jgi:hypothetical protein
VASYELGNSVDAGWYCNFDVVIGSQELFHLDQPYSKPDSFPDNKTD